MCEKGVLHCDLYPANFVLNPNRKRADNMRQGSFIDFDYAALMNENEASCNTHGTVSGAEFTKFSITISFSGHTSFRISPDPASNQRIRNGPDSCTQRAGKHDAAIRDETPGTSTQAGGRASATSNANKEGPFRRANSEQ